jgi:Flp pilus assembly protein TadD
MRFTIPRFCFGSQSSLPPVPLERETLLEGVTEAILVKQLEPAEQTLRILLDGNPTDAAALNLLGTVFELQGNWKAARKHYSRAISADVTYEPAQQNMRRWYELFTFGRTSEPLALHETILLR